MVQPVFYRTWCCEYLVQKEWVEAQRGGYINSEPAVVLVVTFYPPAFLQCGCFPASCPSLQISLYFLLKVNRQRILDTGTGPHWLETFCISSNQLSKTIVWIFSVNEMKGIQNTNMYRFLKDMVCGTIEGIPHILAANSNCGKTSRCTQGLITSWNSNQKQ